MSGHNSMEPRLSLRDAIIRCGADPNISDIKVLELGKMVFEAYRTDVESQNRRSSQSGELTGREERPPLVQKIDQVDSVSSSSGNGKRKLGNTSPAPSRTPPKRARAISISSSSSIQEIPPPTGQSNSPLRSNSPDANRASPANEDLVELADASTPGFTPQNHLPEGEATSEQLYVSKKWKINVAVAGHIRVLDWCINQVNFEKRQAMLFIRIKRPQQAFRGENVKDITINVTSVPDKCTVTTIESRLVHTETLPGLVESTLRVTLSAPPRPLPGPIESALDTSSDSWTWGWDLEVNLPQGTPLPETSQCWLVLHKFFLTPQKFNRFNGPSSNPSLVDMVRMDPLLRPCVIVELGEAGQEATLGGMHRYSCVAHNNKSRFIGPGIWGRY